MLDSVDIIVDMSGTDAYVHDLIQKLADQNFDSVEFTVHVENENLRLKLLNNNQTSLFDGTIKLENYLQSIERILHRHLLNFSVIQHLNLFNPDGSRIEGF